MISLLSINISNNKYIINPLLNIANNINTIYEYTSLLLANKNAVNKNENIKVSVEILSY